MFTEITRPESSHFFTLNTLKVTFMKKNTIYVVFSLMMLIISTAPVNAQWSKTNWPAATSFFSLYANQKSVFARTWDSLNGGRVFLTSDNGANWNEISSADSDIDILSLVMLNDKILAGTWNGFYSSTADGKIWNPVTPSGITSDPAIWTVSMINTELFTGTSGDIFYSSDSGTTWSEMKSGFPANACVRSFVAGMNAIFAGTDTSGIFMKTKIGTIWNAANSGLTDKHVLQLASMGTRLFALTSKGVFISVNNGTNWAANSSNLKNISCLLVVNNELFAGTDSTGVYLSADSGSTWTPFNSGIPAGTRVWSLAVNSDNIFAGTSTGVWRSSFATDIKKPQTFSNSPGMQFRIQNGSHAIIEFSLSSPEKINIDIYNLCGKKVLSVVRKRFEAGSQSISFDTKSITPGSYIIRLIAGSAVYQQSAAIQ